MESLKIFEKRKKDHIILSLDKQTQNIKKNDFSGIGLIPNALPELNFSDVRLNVKLLNHDFSTPHFISSMTAGHKQGFEINSILAEAASKKNWLFCIGSQKKELLNKEVSSEFIKIHKKYPKTKFVSNVGIEEVVIHPTRDILNLANSIDSIGLIIHLNALQEIFQNRSANMKNGLKAISKIVKESDVPVIVKEVGFGISHDVTQKLFDIGVNVVDVAGGGGTHWGMIEALRHDENSVERKAVEAFSDWGFSTVESLLDNQKIIKRNNIWASGGIRSGVDSAKCLALGASAVGIAQPLLKSIVNKNKILSVDHVIKKMEQFDFELKTAMFCTGVNHVDQFSKRKIWYEKK